MRIILDTSDEVKIYNSIKDTTNTSRIFQLLVASCPKITEIIPDLPLQCSTVNIAADFLIYIPIETYYDGSEILDVVSSMETDKIIGFKPIFSDLISARAKIRDDEFHIFAVSKSNGGSL